MAEAFKCPHCGAQYTVTHKKTVASGTANCKICGQEMASWKSSEVPAYKLKQHSITGTSDGH